MPPDRTQQFDRLEQAWQLTRGWNDLPPPASPDTIANFERSRGVQLPADMRLLLARHNGLNILDGNTSISALPSGGKDWNQWETVLHDAPPQFLPFGDDGSDGCYGLWLRSPEKPCAVIDVLEFCWSPDCVRLVSLDLAAFLTTRTVYYLLLFGDCWSSEAHSQRRLAAAVNQENWSAALDALAVPAWIREFGFDLDGRHFQAIGEWAEPTDLNSLIPDGGWTTADLIRTLKD